MHTEVCSIMKQVQHYCHKTTKWDVNNIISFDTECHSSVGKGGKRRGGGTRVMFDQLQWVARFPVMVSMTLHYKCVCYKNLTCFIHI